MPNTLDSAIHSIIARAAGEIAQVVRANIASEINRVVGVNGARGSATRVSAGRAARRPRRGVAEADLQKVLDYIGKNPGKRSEELRAALDLDADYGAKIFAKLRETKKVKTKGERRATTYSAA
jgi:hypothetical protein